MAYKPRRVVPSIRRPVAPPTEVDSALRVETTEVEDSRPASPRYELQPTETPGVFIDRDGRRSKPMPTMADLNRRWRRRKSSSFSG